MSTDLSTIQATEATRIVGSDSTGTEQTPVQSTSAGALHTNLRDSSGNEITSTLNSGHQSLDVNVTNSELSTKDLVDVAGTQGALTVGTSAVAARVGASNLVSRKNLSIFNNSLVTLYWGYTSGVTVSSGTPIYANQFMSIDVGPNVTVYLIAAIAGNNVRITEAS